MVVLQFVHCVLAVDDILSFFSGCCWCCLFEGGEGVDVGVIIVVCIVAAV